MSVGDNVGFGLKMRGVSKADRRERSSRPSRRCGFSTSSIACRTSCPAVSSSAWRWRAPSSSGRGSFARRAVRRARPQAARGAAGRTEGRHPVTRHHIHLRHPRPGRSAGAQRPGRGHEQRQDRAGRSPRVIFEKPANRFVADFMGFANLRSAVVEPQARTRSLSIRRASSFGPTSMAFGRRAAIASASESGASELRSVDRTRRRGSAMP